MLTAPGPKPVREAKKIFFVDSVENFNHRALDDFILQRGNSQRALFAIRLGYVLPPNGQRPVRAALYLCVQALEILLQRRLEVLPCHTVHTRSRHALKRTE